MTINPNFTAAAYLISAVLFIFSLKGLASPTSARLGNALGMVGIHHQSYDETAAELEILFDLPLR